MSQVHPDAPAGHTLSDSMILSGNRIARSSLKFKDFVKNRDLFGESYRMKLDYGREEVKSYMGSLCSLLLTLIIFLYAF